MTIICAVDAGLAGHGLRVCGALNLMPGEFSAAGPSGAPARAVVLVGHAGAGYWRQFSQWRASQPATLTNPLDSWARAILDDLSTAVGGRVQMPNDRPFAPFQQWAMRAQGLRPSPLGLLIHPVYGLWHAYRGALLLEDELPLQQADKLSHPCDLCVGKPCLNACPVEAFSPAGFASQTCRDHVRGSDGGVCRGAGCLARNACPVGEDYRYPAEVQAFHQTAFAGLERP